MNIPRTARTRRPGFTLIEVLVAAGLCMLIMVVMTQAFAAGLDTFSVLKSTGELQERLAVAGTVLQSDLAATHLENQVGEPIRVSGIRFDKIGSGDPAARPPFRGFFRIQQESASALEGGTVALPGLDPDGIPCTKADGSANKGHILHMAIKLPGTRQDRAFTTKLPNAFWDNTDANYGNAPYPALRNTQFLTNLQSSRNDYPVQWAEVAYFLNPTSTGTTAGGTPLFSLHRRIRILTANDNTGISWLSSQVALPGMSCNRAISPPVPPGQEKLLNGPGDITVPDNRLGGKLGARSATSAATIDNFAPLGTGDDILQSNVISFEIKANWDAGFGALPTGWNTPNEAPFDDLPPYQSQPMSATYPSGSGNPSFSRSNLTAADLARPRVFDTWTDRPPHNNWARPEVLTNPGNPQPPPIFAPNLSYVPLPIRLKAIQIKLRIYDPKNKLARQITLIQDM